MSKELIIVESPAKVKTIKKFLGPNYLVEASVGHVRDLPRNELGVDEEHDFEPKYQVIEGKEEVVRKLKRAASKASKVYLAPDPDREGEAIAWHVAELLAKVNDDISRIQFNEITAKAVKDALQNAKPINRQLFDSQQARRILDRLVGYKISPVLWKNVKRGISAGRVQSVALKILVQREKERRAFVPEEYWPFRALLVHAAPPDFWVELWKRGGKAVKPGTTPIGTAEEAEALAAALRKAEFLVDDIKEKQRSRSPLPPFITSTLQQDANRRLGYPSKRTMGIAQRLYEGVELGARGTTALITYMRTDSVRVAKEAQNAAKSLILERWGKEYYPKKTHFFKTKSSAQDAHEAIRPVDVAIRPEDIQSMVPAEQYRLYKLIWERFVASQMANATFWDTVVTIGADAGEAGQTLWRVKGERLLFAGWMAASGTVTAKDSVELPKLAKGDPLNLKDLAFEQKFTQPPPRYSEASLVKELEEKGIGRPSTYAAIISTLQGRDYAQLEEKRFVPTELGFLVSDQLSEHFTELMDVGFTANMENLLDDVAEGKQNWTDLINSFAKDFYPVLNKAKKDMARAVLDTGVVCEECGKPMVVKFGRTGEFLGCSGYPECKTIKNFKRDDKGAIVVVDRAEDEDTGVTCDRCGKSMIVKNSRRGQFLGCSGYPECRNIMNFKRDDEGKIEVVETEAPEIVGKCPDCGGNLVIKRARTGSRFIACDNYPKCDHAKPFSTGVSCPQEECDGEIVEKSSRRGKIFYSCSNYPKCQYAVWDWPVPSPCPDCGHPILVRKTTKSMGEHLSCPQKGCKYKEKLSEDDE